MRRCSFDPSYTSPWEEVGMTRRAKREQNDIFIWNRKYQVGIEKVDKQHRKLVDLINALARELEDECDPATLSRVLDELTSYAAYHFKAEENLMHEWQIDAEFAAEHRESHAAFIREVTEARLTAEGNAQQVTTRILTFLSRWLILHILGTDMRMANEIIALEKGLSPADAKERALSKAAEAHDVLLQAMGELYEALATRTQDSFMANRQLKEEIALHQEAENQRHMFFMAIEHSPVAIFITDAEGVFEYANPKFVELTGYGMADLSGQTPRILRSGDMPEQAYTDFWKSISGKNEWFGEFHNRRKDGSVFWAKTSVTPIMDGNGTITHFLTIQEDVSERKAMEEELHRSHASLKASLEQQRDTSRDLALLNEATDLMLTCQSEAELCRACAQMAGELALGNGGGLALADGAGFRTVLTWGNAAPMPEHFDAARCWGLRRGHLHETLHPGLDLTCSHFQKEPDHPGLCLPLLVKGRAVGVLHVSLEDGINAASRTRTIHLAAALGNAFKLTLMSLRRDTGP